VVIEVIYVLGFREGLWHLLGLILCAFCVSANFVGLALLPGQAAWDDGKKGRDDGRLEG